MVNQLLKLVDHNSCVEFFVISRNRRQLSDNALKVLNCTVSNWKILKYQIIFDVLRILIIDFNLVSVEILLLIHRFREMIPKHIDGYARRQRNHIVKPKR